MRIALIGYGSMGKSVELRAMADGHTIATVVTEHHTHFDAAGLGEALRVADVAIDFSAAEAVPRNVEACLEAGIPLVEGTTGWQDQRDEILEMVEQKGGTMLYGSNFSIGVNLYFRVVEYAAGLYGAFEEYEPFIEEQHHSRKKDSPSGTALMLKDLVSRHTDREISMAATRAGHIPGTHRVGFDGTAEHIELEHSARSRECFAVGAVVAAEWIRGKKGIFEFSDVVDEKIGS
jgi:4-hydroxy-tetrahydrodipicolinate reductase